MNDVNELIETVNKKIGIPGEFNPFSEIVWNPSEESIEAIRTNISEKVKNSNLPTKIKDQHADKSYNSEAPYDQSINKFLNDYSVISLVQSLKASSRALRNSNYIEPNLKLEMLQSIITGWDQISKVIFWLSPTLAKRGRAIYDGFGLLLDESFEGSFEEKLKAIYLANPYNVVRIFKDNLSSKKIGPILFNNLNNNASEIQRYFIALFLIYERPDGWFEEVLNYMNLLHSHSYYLGNICNSLEHEIKNGFISDNEFGKLKVLEAIVVAKHKSAPKSKIDQIPSDMIINEKNKLHIDTILAAGKPKFIKP